MTAIICKALARLNTGQYVEHVDYQQVPSIRTTITDELADLIRAACRGDDCNICFTVAVSANGHSPDCALIKLCEAIAGEKP